MSKSMADHVFTSESVSEGHPDKLADQISDAILDQCLIQDPQSRVACETLVTTDLVVLSGEITTKATLNWEAIARGVIRKVGYTQPGLGFSDKDAKVMVCIHEQSPDISQGVTEGEGLFKDQGAGDQGMAFGYATNETTSFLPATLHVAHRVLEKFRDYRKEFHGGLRPDAKSQISMRYRSGLPVSLETAILSHQHVPGMNVKDLEGIFREFLTAVTPPGISMKNMRVYVNPTGKFEIGGPSGDTGLTGRKIIVDTYGGVGSHGGGAFSGKDPSKVDRSAAYMCRYVAKNVVAAGFADKCEIQVAYCIGVADPVSICVQVYGKKNPDISALEHLIASEFSWAPKDIATTLHLKEVATNDWNYQETAAYGHFGRSQFPWESLDRAEQLKLRATFI